MDLYVLEHSRWGGIGEGKTRFTDQETHLIKQLRERPERRTSDLVCASENIGPASCGDRVIYAARVTNCN